MPLFLEKYVVKKHISVFSKNKSIFIIKSLSFPLLLLCPFFICDISPTSGNNPGPSKDPRGGSKCQHTSQLTLTQLSFSAFSPQIFKILEDMNQDCTRPLGKNKKTHSYPSCIYYQKVQRCLKGSLQALMDQLWAPNSHYFQALFCYIT